MPEHLQPFEMLRAWGSRHRRFATLNSFREVMWLSAASWLPATVYLGLIEYGGLGAWMTCRFGRSHASMCAKAIENEALRPR